jgi:putative copper resistance protein D
MRVRVAVGGALVVLAAAATAWALAYPQSSLSATSVRAIADCAAVLTLGLAVVPMLDNDRHRCELVDRAARPLALAAATWLLAELARLIVAAAEVTGMSVFRLGAEAVVQYSLGTSAGQAALLGVGAAAVCVAGVLAARVVPVDILVAGAAAVGVTARAMTGHFGDSAVGGLAVAAHTLAAALWCGVLAALVLTVQHRGQWARVLPRFSHLSLVCVLVLLAGGTVGAAMRLDAVGELWTTGYGRVLAAKIAVTAVLMVMGWRNRTIWLPAARTHRATAVVSRARSLTELAVMAVALALAAGLAVTG